MGLLSQLSALARESDVAGAARVAAGLDELAARSPSRERELRASAAALRAATEERAVRVAAAGAMRHVMALEEPAQRAPAAAPRPSRHEQLDARRNAAREKRQARAIDEDRGGAVEALERPVESVSGVGQKKGLALRARGIETVRDLVWLLPRRYDDDRIVTALTDLVPGTRQVTIGIVAATRAGGVYGRRFLEVRLEPPPECPVGGGRGMLRLVWFRPPHGMGDRFVRGARVRAAGLVEDYKGVLSMSHPETERLDGPGGEPPPRGVVGRYPEVPGVPPRTLARIVERAVATSCALVEDAVPDAIRAREGLPRLGESLRALHSPPADADLDAWNEARTPHHTRLAFEEFFLLELALDKHRAVDRTARAEPLAAQSAARARAEAALAFALTGAQRRVLDEIARDLAADKPMRRLLQGDVGSGKTAVAILAVAHAVSAGAQAALMVPTEILAEQHFRAIEPMAHALGLRAGLVLGAERASHRRKTRKGLEDGSLDLAVGTHALLNEGVRFKRLRLAIVDEQHRFGVSQRLRLVEKSAGDGDPGAGAITPHLLVMTATPIPRSLALVLYGDLEASVVDEMPPGRIPPVTRAMHGARREAALEIVERALAKDGQAYVVCPVIDESEAHDLRAATRTYEELSERFARQGVVLLHSRLQDEVKQESMERFVRGDARVLVSTTVIEVGVDVPRANVILVEHAERFGLAQLHQLRGRVGRGGQASACLLVYYGGGEDALARLRVLCETSDGFRIAEEDLELRGPGELFGRKQSGLPGFRFGDLRRDAALLSRARDAARSMLAVDPELARAEHAGARRAVDRWERSARAVVSEEAG